MIPLTIAILHPFGGQVPISLIGMCLFGSFGEFPHFDKPISPGLATRISIPAWPTLFGKFVVPRAGQAYDAQTRGSKSKIPVEYISMNSQWISRSP
jgi:hypothetical protein